MSIRSNASCGSQTLRLNWQKLCERKISYCNVDAASATSLQKAGAENNLTTSGHGARMMKTQFFERRKFFDPYGALPNQQASGMPPRGVRLTLSLLGATLRTRNVKQCRKCRRDWHDPEKVIGLSVE
jgi:hypothetical protein